jgi:diguanylate cyclase (GGDEF)-like protein/PAS domain S-box-containing protein
MKKIKVLVVEDEGLVARDVELMVKGLGYSVIDVLATGEEAIEKAQKSRPDLILMDITLRGKMDGIEAGEKIRRLTRIPVIYLTAHTDEATFQRAKVTAPYGYTLKPIEQNELKTVIEMALYKHEMEVKLKEREEWLSTILISIGDGVIATNRDGHVTFMNPIAERLTGWIQEASIDRPLYCILNLVSEETKKRVDFSAKDLMEETRLLADYGRLAIVNKGEKTPVEITTTPIKDEAGTAGGLVLVLRDITERRRHEEQLVYLAIHDSLTGLPNRSLFYDRLGQAFAQAKRHQQKIALFMLDLDHFKRINDTFGHHMGDKVLQGVASRLRASIRESDTIARLGGDEFVMLFPELHNDEDAIPIAQRMRQTFHLPFEFDGFRIEITASIGISMYPQDGEDADALLKNADRAMYKVKEKGRGAFRFFTTLRAKDQAGTERISTAAKAVPTSGRH